MSAEHEATSYGLHWDGPVAWLIQGRGSTNFVGLKKHTPFQAPKFACNHLIPAAAPIPDRLHWDMFLKMGDCELIQRLLPIPQPPESRISYIEADNDFDVLRFTPLSRLSSPIRPIVKPAWTIKVRDLPKELCTTNVQPLIITGLNQTHQALISALTDLSPTFPRTVIMSGDDSVVLRPRVKRLPSMEETQFNLEDLILLPIENIGATVLRRYARKEEIFVPIESRDDRRNRMIKERNGAENIPDR